MKIAIISNIHGKFEVLKETLKDIKKEMQIKNSKMSKFKKCIKLYL